MNNNNRILQGANKKRIEIKRMNKITLKSEYILVVRDKQVTLLGNELPNKLGRYINEARNKKVQCKLEW